MILNISNVKLMDKVMDDSRRVDTSPQAIIIGILERHYGMNKVDEFIFPEAIYTDEDITFID